MKFGWRSVTAVWEGGKSIFPVPRFENASNDPFTLGMARGLAGTLRTLLEDIDQGRPLVGKVRQDLGAMIGSLENTCVSLNPAMTAHGRTDDRRKFMIQCLVLADTLAADADLRFTLKRSLEITLPAGASAELVTLLENQTRIPHHSELSRARLCIDVAHMRWRRDVHQRQTNNGGSFRYMMVDSSPHYKRDFENLLSKSFLQNKGKYMLGLYYELNNIWNDSGVEQFFDEEKRMREKEIIALISECIDWHAIPPAQVGFGASSLRRKLHSALHAIRLECHSNGALSEMVWEFSSWLFDHGTEYGIVAVRQVTGAFPFWKDSDSYEQVHNRSGGDGAGHDVDCIFDELKMPEPEPKVDHTFDELEQGDGSLDGPDDIDPQTLHFGETIGLDGTLHVIDNAWIACFSAMPRLKGVVRQSKHFCRLFRGRDTRAKLKQRCYNDTIGRLCHAEIDAFSGNIHPARWGTCSFSIPKIRAIERVARYGWDLSKYSVGADAKSSVQFCVDSEDDDYKVHATNIEEANSAIASPFYWAYLQVVDHLCAPIRRLFHWAEWCPCHGKLVLALDGLADGQLKKDLMQAWETCPLRECMTGFMRPL